MMENFIYFLIRGDGDLSYIPLRCHGGSNLKPLFYKSMPFCIRLDPVSENDGN